MVDPVVQGALEVQLVPWDLEALPDQSVLPYPSFRGHPERPELGRCFSTVHVRLQCLQPMETQEENSVTQQTGTFEKWKS